MDFWNYLNDLIGKEHFSEERLVLGGRKSTYLPNERAHTSLSSVVELSKEVNPGDIFLGKNSTNMRYVLARNISYDMLLSIYGVASESGLFARISMPLNKNEIYLIKKGYEKVRDKEIEVRLIGMQNKQSNFMEIIKSIYFLSKLKNALVEVDLFGNEIRHIAIDLKTGLTYNLLLEDRIYRPGELICNLKFDDVLKNASRLKLV